MNNPILNIMKKDGKTVDTINDFEPHFSFELETFLGTIDGVDAFAFIFSDKETDKNDIYFVPAVVASNLAIDILADLQKGGINFEPSSKQS